MSRCFPFPPPGYEKKARPDDENLLAKEKHKEKKHKKEKKDREKRDKKDKDRSEEKHREKKDRKEKHNDKKEKRKDKDKGEKKKTSDEKNITLPPPPPPPQPPPENHNHPENLADDTTEFKFLFELGKRNREDDEGATENHMVQKINLTGQRRAELPNYIVESNNTLAETNEFVMEKREEIDEKNQIQSYTKDIEIDSSVKKNNNSVNSVGIIAEKQQTEEKEKSSSSKRKHSSGESKNDKHKDRDREKKSSKSKKREKKEKEEKTKEKNPDKDQEQIKLKETGKISDEFRNSRPLSEVLGKRKESEVNGFLHENEIRPNKLPRPATSSSHQNTENGGSKAEPSRLSAAAKSLPPPERKGVIVNNLKTNGLNLLPNPQVTADNGKKTEQSVWLGTGNNHNHNPDNKIPPSPSNSGNPNSDKKVQLQTTLSHPILENGRKLEPCQTASSSQGKIGIGVIPKTDKKIQNGINGLTEVVQEPVVFSTKPPPPPPVKKSPHPDSKYLSQILTVPSVEWSDFDDQEWLFGNKDSENSNRIRSDSTSQVEPVWAEAVRVESADITALPYVIPY